MRTIEIRVEGKVQGVYYRATAREKARELGLTGYARNLRDGTVYMMATGDSVSLEHFLDWCRVGPPAAVVERVEVKECLPETFPLFEIRR